MEDTYIGVSDGRTETILRRLILQEKRLHPFAEDGFEIGEDTVRAHKRFHGPYGAPDGMTQTATTAWRSIVRLNAAEHASLGRWLQQVGKHIRRRPWHHPRWPGVFRFEWTMAASGKTGITFIWSHKLGETSCTFPADVVQTLHAGMKPMKRE